LDASHVLDLWDGLMMSTFVSMRFDVPRCLGQRFPAGVVAFLLVVAVLALVGASADAAPKGTVAAFGGSGSGAGEFSLAGSVAVNQASGDVYVVDVANERVQQFNADGDFIRAWGGNVVTNAGPDPSADPAVHQICTASPCSFGTAGSGEGVFSFANNFAAGIAVDPTDGSVYVADTGNNRVQKFTADGAFVSQFRNAGSDPGNPAELGELSGPSGVAVHPTTGDVVVADTNNSRVLRFDSSGTFEAEVTPGSARSVAVDSTGAVYVVGQSGGPRKVAADGAPLGFAYQTGNPVHSIAVDPVSDQVFVAQWFLDPVSGDFQGSEVLELDSTGAVIDHHRYRPESVDAYGVAVRADTGRIYVSQTFENRVFILDDPVQTAAVLPTTDVTSRSATLNGTINPNGGLPVSYHFEVSADDGQTWTSFPETDDGPFSDTGADIPVSQLATGLQPGRHYQVRLVVRNEFGSTFVSPQTPDSTFDTLLAPPDVETGPATQITSTSALLTGEVNANNAETTYHFEWGNTTSYGNRIPVTNADAGSAGSPITVTQKLDGLLSDITYHYRLVATNSEGTALGADRTLHTHAAAPPPPGRGYELVSPADKVGGVGVGHWYGGPDAVGLVGYAAHDGERFAVRGQQGSTITQDGAFAYVNDWVFAERTPAGWGRRPAISRRAHAPQPTTDITLNTATPDLSVTGWGSAQFPKLFPEMADWPDVVGSPFLIRRWNEPEWMLFGPTDPSQDVPPLDENGQPLPGNNNPISAGPKAFALDGSAVVASAVGTRGLAGSGDPTSFGFDDRDDDAASVYLDEIGGGFSDVFPGDDGVRELVNVCTAGTVIPTSEDETLCPAPLEGRSARLTSPGGASLTSGTSGGSPPPGVISADGSRVFFMSPDPNLDRSLSGPLSTQLFVRQRNSDGGVVTRWISRTEVAGQSTSLRAPAFFEGASRDGDKVFFRTTSPLTNDDPNGGCGAPCVEGGPSDRSSDLFMYDLQEGGDPAGGVLTRVSAGPSAEGDCNTQPGTLRFVSDDASRVYFTCAASLAGLSGSSNGTVTSPGGAAGSSDASNLYLHDTRRAVPQRWRFIARLPRTSTLGACATTATSRGSLLTATPGGTGNTISLNASNSCVRGTSKGSLVTFFTDGRLTADDPDASSGDVYGYDLDRDELTRLSAPQGGVGGPYPCEPGKDATSAPCHGDGGIGPGAMAVEMLGVAVDSDGRRSAFFESRSRLVTEDTDGGYDVYQWREGDLSLISTGVSDPDGAFYVGNDRSGLNVYFVTRDQLTWQDKDRVLDVYTARVGGGIPEPSPVQPCAPLADACRGSGAQPVTPQVGSSRPGGRNLAPGRAKTLALRRLTSAQLRRAARTGRIKLRVRVSSPGRVSVSARARLASRTRVIGRASKPVSKPGPVTISLRLTGRARGVLARGRVLRVTLRASQRGAESRSMTVRLRRNSK
jgi:DNA-binding beta-propeller fold protein YncE